MSGAKPERGRLKPFDHTKANPQLTNELLERALSALNAKLVNSRTAAPRRVWTSKGKEFRPIALFGDARLHQAIVARLDSEDPEGPSGDAAEEAELARLEAIHGRIPLTDDHIRWHVRGCDPIGMEAYFGSYTQETREGVPGGITLAFDLDDEACEFHGKTPLQVAQDISAQVAAVGLGQYVYAYTSHGGKGVHVHVLLDFFCPSWLRKRVGEALVRLAGYPTGAGRAKGLIEVNPKGSADNLCTPLGLPLASHLVPEGRTSPLDLQSGYRTTDYLAAVELTERAPQCPREGFFAAARLLGIDPERKPEPPTFSSVTKVPIRTTSGQVVDLEVVSPWAEIARQVLLRLDLRRELAQFGRTVHGVKTTCPMHNEPLDGALSLTVFPATDLAGKLGIPGLEMWKCWGDCNCKGDAIKLWQIMWSCSRREAITRLAQRADVNVNVAALLRERREQQEAMLARLQPESPHPRLARWAELAAQIVATEPLREKFTLALGRVLLPLGLDLTTLGVSLAAGFRTPAHETLLALEESKRRLEGQQACPGLPWIRRRISPAGMRELSRIVTEILKPESPAELERKIVGPHRPPRGGPGRMLLRDWRLVIPRKLKVPKPGSKPPWWADKKDRDDDEQDQEHVAHMTSTTTAPEHPDTRIRSMLHWPAACGDFNQTVRGDGQKVGQIGITCNMVSVCVGCAMNHFGGVYDLLTGSADPQENPAHELSWRGKATTFHAVWTSVPLAFANVFLKDAGETRRGSPRLRLLGMNLERPGWVKIMFVTHDLDSSEDALAVIRSGLDTASDTCPELAAMGSVGRWNWHGRATTTNVKLAASWVFEQGMSLGYYAAECVERADKAAMFAYLHWVKGKSFARSTGKRQDGRPRLRVPPRAVVRAATQKHASDMAMYDGQKLTYELTWGPSGYVLGTRDQPWTIGGALAVAESSQSFQDHVVLFDQQQSLKVRGAVPATA